MEPLTDEQKAWVIGRLNEFMKDGGGSFRTMLEYLKTSDYRGIYCAGGMNLSNIIFDGMEANKKGSVDF